MIRDRLQTTLLEEAQDTIAHLTVENRRLTDTVSFLEHELEAAMARLDERSVSTTTVEASTAGVDPSTAPPARQVLLLQQQQLVEKEAQLQVMGAQQRMLAENVDTLEAMLQDKRRSEMRKATSLRDAMREEIPSRHLHASSSTDISAETTNALAGVVRKLQDEARHARESERNYARMVDALQQELLFTQRQLVKTRRAPCDTAQLSAPPAPPAPKVARGPPRLPPSLIPSLVQQCEANTSALSEMELTVSALQDRCADVTHWDAEIITFLQTRLAAKEQELAQLRQQSFASEIS